MGDPARAVRRRGTGLLRGPGLRPARGRGRARQPARAGGSRPVGGAAALGTVMGPLETARSADGVAIRFQVSGQGEPTLVLVHGWALDHRLWDGQVPRLSARHRVVTLDLAGHGASGRQRARWTMAAFGD